MRKTTLPTLLVANPSMRRRRRLRNRKLIVALFVGAVCFLFVTGLLLYSVATSGNGSSDAGRVKPVVEETDPPAEVRSEYPTIHTEEAHPVDPRFAPAEVTDEHRVRTLDEINQHLFFRVRHVASGMWLGYDAAVSDTPNRLTLLIQRRRQNDAFAVQGALGMYLAVNRDDSVVMDRSTARSQEMWNLKVAPSSGTFYLAALKTGKLVRGKDCHSKPNEKDGQLYATSGQTCALVADVVPENVHESDAISEAAPARWEIFVEPDPNCYVSHETVADLRQDAVARNGEFSEERAAVMKEIMRRCHGEPTGEDADEEKKGTTFKASTGGSGLRGAMTVPLFGSPKPLTELKPLDASNKYDAFIIARRTIANWACISGFLPLILADDSGNKALVEELNRVNAAHETASFTPIRLSPSFELHKRFSQPTYRGLFLRAFEEFPEAMVVMYANSDILFTSTAMETIRAVAASFEVMRRSQPRLTGWFAVGQRTNVDVDPHWSIGAVPGEDEGAMRAEEEEQRNWESHMETTLKKKGKIFQTLAEDYFIVSRGMFDWNNEIPDFVVGGTAFDNWITTKAVKKSREGTALVVDVTQTLTAIHQNHATNIKASHQHPKSQYNNRLAASRGGWSLGHTSDCPHLTVRGGDGSILVIPKRQLLVKMDTSRRTRMWDRVSSILEEVDPTRVMDTSRILRLQLSNGLSDSELYHALLSHYQDKDSDQLLLQLHISVLSEMWIEWLNQVAFPSAVTRRTVTQFSAKRKKEIEKAPSCYGPLDVVKDGAVLYRLLRDAVEYRQCVKSGTTYSSFDKSTTSEPSSDANGGHGGGSGTAFGGDGSTNTSNANFSSAKNGCGNSTLVSCGSTPLVDAPIEGKQGMSTFSSNSPQSQVKRHRRLRITSTTVEVCPLTGKAAAGVLNLSRHPSAIRESSTKEPSSSTTKSTGTPFSPIGSDSKEPDNSTFVDRQSSVTTCVYHYDANDGDGACSRLISPNEHTEDDDGGLMASPMESGDGHGDSAEEVPHKALQEAMDNISYVCAICRENLGWKEKDEIFSVGDLACVYDDDVVVKRLHWIALALYRFVNNTEIVPMPPLMSYVVYDHIYPGIAEEDENNIAIGVAMLSSCLPQTHHLGITLRENRVYVSHATSQMQPFELPCCIFEKNVFCYYANRVTPFWYVVRQLLEQWDKLVWIAETPQTLKSIGKLLKEGAKQRSIPTVTITLSSQSASTSAQESGIFVRPEVMHSPSRPYESGSDPATATVQRGSTDRFSERATSHFASAHTQPAKSHVQVKESEMAVGRGTCSSMTIDTTTLSKTVSYLEESHHPSSGMGTVAPSTLSTHPNTTDIFDDVSSDEYAGVQNAPSGLLCAAGQSKGMTSGFGTNTSADANASSERNAEEIISSMNTANMRGSGQNENLAARSTNSSFGLQISSGATRVIHASPLVQHSTTLSWNEYAETSFGSAGISPLIFGGQEGSWTVRTCAPMHNFTATVIHEYEGKVAVTEHQFRMSGKPIGRGAFGAVFKALDMNCGATVAVKQSKVAVDGEFNINERELGLWSMIPAHPNVITFYGASRERDTNHILLVIEYADGGNIGTLYSTFGPIKEQLFLSHAMQFAQGLKHLHDHGVVHGDVKPENVMTRSDGKVAIGDFGCSRLLQRGGTDKPKSKGHRQENLGVFGTAHYMAPETIDSASCYKSDVWAYACTLVCIWTSKLPWFECGVMSKDAIPLMFHIATCKDWPYSEEFLSRSTPRWLLRVAHRAFQRDVELRCNMVEVISILSEYME